MTARIRLHIVLVLSPILLGVGFDSSPASTPDEEQAIAQLQSLNKAFTAIARRVTPTVVTVSTKQVVERDRRRRRRGPEFFQPFFGDPRLPEEREERGLGSGIIMTEDGYILTNHHVAGKANKITVILSDNREYEAELVGSDELTDVAVIKVDARNLKMAETGNSDRIEIGEWVLAIGAPLELQSTVTSGIVSAIGRDINIFRDSYGVEDFIQTDAAINPGNSGGALVHLKVEVIGVNTAIATYTGRFVGYGFAIPINLATKVMDDIVAYGRVRRGYLGVGLEGVSASEADAFGLDRPRGVLISQVLPDTPAESAGLNSGDIILKVDGQEVNRPNHVQSLIARKHPDDTVSLEVRRTDKTLTLKATLGENAPTDSREVASDSRPGSPDEVETGPLGLTIQNLTPELSQRFGLEEGLEGVVVIDVGRGPAREARFQPGDIIFGVRQQSIVQDIRSAEDFKTALGRLQKGRHAAFSVFKRGVRMFLTVKIPE